MESAGSIVDAVKRHNRKRTRIRKLKFILENA